MKKIVYLTLALVCGVFSPHAKAGVAESCHQLQQQLESALLDAYEGDLSPETIQQLNHSWQEFAGGFDAADARSLAQAPPISGSNADIAAAIGVRRSLLQHLAAMETLHQQENGQIETARVWRNLITLPKFADADQGGLLLQQSADQARLPTVTQALAREYIGWQVTRTRQLLDHLQRTLATDDVNAAYVLANLAEVQALAHFPKPLLQAAGVASSNPENTELPSLVSPYQSPASTLALAAWREKIEATLPNLLSPKDITRLERLLARFIDVIPKEYRNGVQDGKVVIPLEYKEAVQFTQQAQGLTNELAPVWSRDRHDVYDHYHAELVQKLEILARHIDRIEPLSVIEGSARDIGSLLENRFGLSARRAGDKGQIIEETAFDVRTSLNQSLAAATSGHWQEAESLRLDAYTAFDSEIEVRVLPRNPALATRTERSFLDGQEEPGIKALLDRAAPRDELSRGYERAIKNLQECTAMLQVSVSPTTVGFTAFTIMAREGLEAIVILAAVLAGLRGMENRQTRRGIVIGALLAIVASALTFWLSQTIIHSLVRYGEKLEAIVSVLAVIILLMVTNWVFHKVYWVEWNAKLRHLSKTAQMARATHWELFALMGVGFLTVYREGFETTIFMQSLILEGSTTPVALGLAAGFVFIGGIGALIFIFSAKLPYRKLLVLTGVLVVSIMITFLGSTVRLFQTVGWLGVHPIHGLSFPNWMGTWIGLYPSYEGLLIPPLGLLYVAAAWLYTKWTVRNSQSTPSLPVSLKSTASA